MMSYRIKKLTELTLEGKMHPVMIPVEYDRKDLFLPDEERDIKRIREYVLAQEPILTPWQSMTGFFKFDGSCPGDYMFVAGMKHINEALGQFYNQPLDNLSTFEWQHATPDVNRIVHVGIRGMKDEIAASLEAHSGDEKACLFLNALDSVADTMILWAHKCSQRAAEYALTLEEPEYRQNMLKLSEALTRVPENPAGNLYEALLMIYITYAYDPDSIGLIDRYLYHFYKEDLAAGIIDNDKAKEYLQELFLMLQAKTSRDAPQFTKGGESHFAVGGYLPNGEDGFTEFSMLIIEAMEELPTFCPQISLRWTKKLPYETFKKVMDIERHDPNKRIAFVNDESRIPARNNRMSYEDAVSYTTLGCNETAFPGGFVGGTTNTNIMRSMENTFFKRTEDVLAAKSFDEFFAIYREELWKDLREMIRHNDDFNRIRAKDTSYVSSLFFEGCISEAKPLTHGACRLASSGFGAIGLTNAVDSLIVVKQFVYDEKTVDMKTLVDALHCNWKGYEDLHTLIRKTGRFFGNDDAYSNEVALLFYDTVYEELDKHTDLNGYIIGIGNLQGYNPHHHFFGERTKASPDGRYDGNDLKFGLGQSGGYDRNGLTALANAIALVDSRRYMSGSNVSNFYLDSKLMKDDESFEKVCRTFETYFLNGGVHFQLNYVDKELLLKAKEDPEHYGSIRVRVSGFSDFFVNLPESIQDDVMARTVLEG